VKPYLKILLLLAIPLALIVAYSLSSKEIGEGDYMLEKANFDVLKRYLPSLFQSKEDSIEEIALHMPTDCWPRIDTLPPYVEDSADIKLLDSLLTPPPASAPKPVHVAVPDSGHLRILLFGDSMIEGISRRLADYASQSDYDLSSVIWYSSSTKLWAETDTLQYFLDRVKPDYILLCLGSNELFVRDLAKREGYISTILSRISSKPFVWISPPNWKPDSGINDLIINAVGRDRYFDSRNLELERGSDHAHPTREAARYWADTIASWLNSSAPRYPLSMTTYEGERPRRFHQYVLQPLQ